MSEPKRKIKARYRVTGPRKETVQINMCSIDKETKSLMQGIKEIECETYMVYFPNGHSIRCLNYDHLKELGFHIKPRLVDMESGDVIDPGGDPYDFGEAVAFNSNNEELAPPVASKQKAAA